jgi:MFS family permease
MDAISRRARLVVHRGKSKARAAAPSEPRRRRAGRAVAGAVRPLQNARFVSTTGRTYYGWRIVAVAFLTHCLNVGCVFYSFGVFFTPLIEEFGWTRAQISWGFSSVSIVGALWSPLVGRVVDRHGPRRSQIFGALVLGGTFMLLSTVQSLVQYYLLMALLVSLGSTALGPIPSNSAVAGWFLRRRGRALGLATAGISMGGVIFVPLAQTLIHALGWRQAFVALGALVIGVGVAPIAFVMRKPPAELPPEERMPALAVRGGRTASQRADEPALAVRGGRTASQRADEPALAVRGGRTASQRADEPALAVRGGRTASQRADGPAGSGSGLDFEIEHSVTARDAVRDPNFWLIASAFSLTVMGLSAVLLHQVPLLIDMGVTPAHAALALGATAGVGVVGKLGFGALLDRVEQRRVIVGCFLAQAAGLLLLPFAHVPALLVLYVVVYGYSMGGNATLQATVLGECFGRRHYGAIAGRMGPIIVFAQAVAVPLVGWLRDRTGSYLPAIAVIEVMTLAAALCISRLRPPVWRRVARAA